MEFSRPDNGAAMSKTKKPKAIRIHMHEDAAGELMFHVPSEDVFTPFPANATVIPDGAPIPLPASVRRVMRLLLTWEQYRSRNVNCAHTHNLFKAIDQYNAAEARRKGE